MTVKWNGKKFCAWPEYWKRRVDIVRWPVGPFRQIRYALLWKKFKESSGNSVLGSLSELVGKQTPGLTRTFYKSMSTVKTKKRSYRWGSLPCLRVACCASRLGYIRAVFSRKGSWVPASAATPSRPGSASEERTVSTWWCAHFWVWCWYLFTAYHCDWTCVHSTAFFEGELLAFPCGAS